MRKELVNNLNWQQLQITDVIVMFIASDLLPLSTIESENFRNLMTIAEPKYQLPSRKHFTSKLLHDKSSKIRTNVNWRKLKVCAWQ